MKFYVKYLTYMAFGVLALSCYYSYEIYQAYEVKASQQRSINKNADQVRSTWQGLQPTVDAWSNTFVSVSSVNSLYELNKVLALETTGVNLSASSMFEAGASAITYQGYDIGLVSRCVKNGTSGFQVESGSLENALSILSYVEQRLDLSWDAVALSSDGSNVKLSFPHVCVHLRVAEGV